MRKDNIGLFWQDLPSKSGGYQRKQPKIPKTGWKAPTSFPNLTAAKCIALDTETYDPGLLTKGAGWATGEGHIVGISVAVSKKDCWYFPMRHTVKPGQNLDPDKVLAWAKDNLTGSGKLKLGANITYDIGWLRREGVLIPPPYLDVQHAEALIDEQARSYALDTIANKYLGKRKVSAKMYKWLARFYGGKANSTQGKNIYRCPPSLVGHYAEADATLPFEIWHCQKKIIEGEGLTEVLDIECRLIPMLLDMRFKGVKVDVGKAEEVRDSIQKTELLIGSRINALCGMEININASASIEKGFLKRGLSYPLTEKGNPSFTKDWLNNQSDILPKMISEARLHNKIRKTFLEGYILGKNRNGVIHCEFKQLKGAGGGTVSGRFSSANPNLQNIPSRTELGKQVRSCFIPHYGKWWRGDSSQIEYRLLAHYAHGKGAKRIRKAYKKDSSTDYHAAASELIYKVTGVKLERKPTKTINFGLCYGMGEEALRQALGVTKEESHRLFDAYHTGLPFVKDTFNRCMLTAENTGLIKTFLGRRCRYNTFEEQWGGKETVDNETVAALKWRQYKRAFTFTALNRLLQGSAADHLKKSMVLAYEAGVFQVIGAPALTVHDELDGSYDPSIKGHLQALKELKHIMQTSLKLRVPLLVDFEDGVNWGTCKARRI